MGHRGEITRVLCRRRLACGGGACARATRAHNKLLDLMNVNFIESNPIPVKAALAMMGLIKEQYRLPLVRLSDRHRPALRAILKNLKLL